MSKHFTESTHYITQPQTDLHSKENSAVLGDWQDHWSLQTTAETDC